MPAKVTLQFTWSGHSHTAVQNPASRKHQDLGLRKTKGVNIFFHAKNKKGGGKLVINFFFAFNF